MLYKLLGMAVWNGGKWYLGRRYGGKAGAAKALAFGGAAAVAAGAVVLLARRGGSDD
jgi:hypothetical protein